MSASTIDELLEVWTLSSVTHEDGSSCDSSSSPFCSHKDLYDTIDSIKLGDAKWQCLVVNDTTAVPSDAPDWRKQEYQVWFHDPDTVLANMLDNPDFADQFDYAPYIETDEKGKRRWTNFMSGNFPWRHCVCPFHSITIHSHTDRTLNSV